MPRKLNLLFVQQTALKKRLRIFTPDEFRRAFGVSLSAARDYLKKHSHGSESLFLKLRNGLYTLRTHLPDEYVTANRIYQPSYVSLETVLARHSIIPEIVYTITSVTPKATREFTTGWLTFSYQRIKRQAFTGYVPTREEGSLALVAVQEKAVADYLYFVDLKHKILNDRLDLAKVSRVKVETYARLFGRKSLMDLIARVYDDQRKPRRIY